MWWRVGRGLCHWHYCIIWWDLAKAWPLKPLWGWCCYGLHEWTCSGHWGSKQLSELLHCPNVSNNLFSAWKGNLAPSCKKNYSGSANSMEIGAATVLFGCSIQKQSLLHKSDLQWRCKVSLKSKQGGNLRCRSNQRRLCQSHACEPTGMMKKKLSGTKQSSGGRGNKVPNLKMRKMSNDYDDQLKRNAPDPVAMWNGVMASLVHIRSSDEKPRHELCLMGEV